ncbi:MAG: PepSY domain-containing protein [Proteobacteria bacterium]|nr:PepSY domain-containing protein [Pseudomonadota bacterium]
MISTSHDPAAASPPRATPIASASERDWLRVLRTAHLWTALVLCLPLALLGVTGSLLVFEHELEHLIDHTPRRIVAGGVEQSQSAIIAAARAAAPAGATPSLFIAADDPEAAAVVRLSARGAGPGPGALQVFVDPVSLEIMGTRTFGIGLVRQIFLLHANLMTRDRSGREIVGWFGVAMLGLGLSGLVLWWPRGGQWRTAFGVRRGVHGYRLFRELHGAVGIWGVSLLLVVSASGSYLAFPQTIGAAVATVVPTRDLRTAPSVARPADATQPIALDDAVAAARAVVADGSVRLVGFPARPDQPFRIAFLRPGDAVGQPLTTAFVDPWTGRVIELRDPGTYSLGETVLAWQHAIHAGQGLGGLWRGLVLASGLLPPFFVVTGITMWLIKRRVRRSTMALRTTGE